MALLLPLPIILLLIVFFGGFIAWVRVRDLRIRSILQIIGMITGQNLPLAAGLRAAAAHESRSMRRMFQTMATRLEAGDSLHAAVRTAYPVCPGHIAGALQGAERGGTLPSVLRSLAAEARRAEPPHRLAGSPALPYALVMLCVVPLTLLFLIIQVVPKFNEIFVDFGLDPLGESGVIFDVAIFLGNHAGKTSLAALALVILGLQLLFGHFLMVRVPDRLQWFPAMLDTLTWHLPLLRHVSESRALARQLPVFQAAIQSDQDIPAAATQAACVAVNYHARRRLKRWAARIRQGGDPVHEARRLGFPAPVMRVLVAGRDAGTLGAGLEYLAMYYRSLVTHWGHVLSAILMPAAVLTWGLCIGYLVLCFFMPLVAIMHAVMEGTY